jgi:ceramide glucosyltransferase
LVDTLLANEDAGSAFAPVVVTEDLVTLGDAGYALLLNGLYGPAAAAAANRNGGSLPFIMGQTMVFKRAALAAIGGLESAQGQLVDDMYFGRRLVEAGYRNMVAPITLPIIQRGLSLGDFVGIFVRWIAFSRSGLPASSVKAGSWTRCLVFFLGLGASLAALALGYYAAAVLAALVPVLVAASINQLHREHGGAPLAPRHWWASFAVVVASPLVMLRVLLRRDLDWRGRRYTLDTGSQLTPTVAVSGEYPDGPRSLPTG